MRIDAETEQDVREELLWEPGLTGADISAEVHNGKVTLTGKVSSYSKKALAEKVVKRIAGVKAINNELRIVQLRSIKHSDLEIEKAIREIFKWSSTVDQTKVNALVKNGWVTLEGEVDNGYQKAKAERLIEDLEGVKGITNDLDVITEESIYKETVVLEKINAAFRRNFYLDANKINAEVEGNIVVLSGEVRTLAEKEDAERAAASAPGIKKVINKLLATYAEAWA